MSNVAGQDLDDDEDGWETEDSQEEEQQDAACSRGPDGNPYPYVYCVQLPDRSLTTEHAPREHHQRRSSPNLEETFLKRDFDEEREAQMAGCIQDKQNAPDTVSEGPNGELYVYSTRPPEEVFLFGLNWDTDTALATQHHIYHIRPEERGIATDRDDGLCTFCQLLLLPDAPEYSLHHPSLPLLVESAERCSLCKVISSSLSKGCPQLLDLFKSGYKPLYDRENTATAITVHSTKDARHTQVTVTCGSHGKHPGASKATGKPFIWTTCDRLGPNISERRIWSTYHDPNFREPITRLDVLNEWLNECQEDHPDCIRLYTMDSPRLPTRVLEITEDDESEEPFALRLHASNGECGVYTALSHKWGSLETLKTLKSNLARHEQHISWDALSRTFQDAVLMTYYVGSRYLWVDSLCIIQDDEQDWESEAARMADVYSNALLTFAATAAEDGSTGCQFNFKGTLCIPIENGPALVRYEDHLQLDTSKLPLNTRGWTFQETLLSKRMVCFTEDQMLWKCATTHESEDGLLHLSSPDSAKDGNTWNVWASDQIATGEESKYNLWYGMMKHYSCRELKYTKDKLPALAGIVREFARIIDDTPVLGLWKRDLLRGLLWRTSEPSSRLWSDLKIPSWSWISVNGAVNWDALKGVETAIANESQILELSIKWTGLEMTSPLLEATLQVRGRLKRAELSRWEVEGGNSYHLQEVEDQEEPNQQPEVLGYCYLEELQPAGSHVWCLVVNSFARNSDAKQPRNEIHQVLVLTPADGTHGPFKRIGVGIIWRTSYRQGEDSTGLGTMVKESLIDADTRTLVIV